MKTSTKRFCTLLSLLVILILALSLSACGEEEVPEMPPAPDGPIHYSVTFLDIDGTILQTGTVAATEEAYAPNVPRRPGYLFTGWDKTFDRVTSDLVITAQYKRLWEVRFVDHDGALLKTEAVPDGNGATAPREPSLDNYDFTGWDKPFTCVTSDMTVTATYRVKVYHITFVDYDNTVLKTEDVEAGHSATAPANPTREHHDFIGWDRPFTVINGNMTIKATYREHDKLSVQFVDHDGTVLKTENVYPGESATAPASPTRENHVFTGWDKAYDHITESIKVTAQYRESAKYTVTFTDHDGAALGTAVCYEGKTVTAIADPTREDHLFRSWTLNGATYDFTQPVTGNITLVASYARVRYTMTYMDEAGNILATVPVADGVMPATPAAPFKAHHAFLAWVVESGSTESGNVIYKPQYGALTHVVTFLHANGTDAKTPVTVDDCRSVAAEASPLYNGFTFVCWETTEGLRYDFTTQVTKDITLRARYVRNAEIPAATSDLVTISPGHLEFWEGLELQLNIQAHVTRTEENGKLTSVSTDVHYDGMTFTFYTDDTNVITITEDGVITPVALGKARVWAVIHKGGTMIYSADKDYTVYDTFSIPDGTVLAPIEVEIIEKPDYLQLFESDTANQQIQLPSSSANRININDFLKKPAGDYGSANIALWYNDTTAVFTMTVDDNIVGDFEQWNAWQEEYQIPISIMAITRNYQRYVNRWADMTLLGNEVQPHGQNHHAAAFYSSGYLTTAEAWNDSYLSKKVIEASLDSRAVVYSYPCGYNTPLNKYLYIGGRGVSRLPVSSSNINYNNVNLQNIPSAAQMASFFDPTVGEKMYPYGGWLNFLQHNIGSDKSKYETFFPIAEQYIDSGELWAALFSDACRYGQERDTATLSNLNAGRDIITFTLTDRMNDLLFDHALTVKIKVDSTWTHARAYQNGAICDTRIVNEGGNTYVYVNAVPDKGEVTVVRTTIGNLSLQDAYIAFTPVDARLSDERHMTVTFPVDGAVWAHAYATQGGSYIPSTITTRFGKTTVSVTCEVNGGEVILVPLTDQLSTRESLTMYEVWRGYAVPDGSIPVLLSSPEDLVYLSDYVMHHGKTAGVTFRLTADIDMSEVTDLRPIGWQTDPGSNGDRDAKSPFLGTFDGAGHTIYNLHIYQPGLGYVGLFGYTEGATISSLTVIGSVEGFGRVGGIVGRMVKGEMNNVIFKGSVTARGHNRMDDTGSWVGGLVGQFDSGIVKNAAAYASINAFAVYKDIFGRENAESNCGSYVGGLFGMIYYAHQATSQCTLDNLIFEGTVTAHRAPNGTGAHYVGGLSGYTTNVLGSNITIRADITGNNYVGGFIGAMDETFTITDFKSCSVSGTVTGNDYVAGLVGKVTPRKPQYFYNCFTAVVVHAAAGCENVGALFGVCPYTDGPQNITTLNLYYIENLNPGMAPNPGTVKDQTKHCIPVASATEAIAGLNTYATANQLAAWRLSDGVPSPSYFPVFSVTFLDKDGKVLEEQMIGNGLPATLPDAPYLSGFEFDHWSVDHTCITADTIIRAVYREVETFTVIFTDNEGNPISTQKVNAGRGAIAPTPKVYDRLIFTAWEEAFDKVTSDMTIKPIYAECFYVTFAYRAEDGSDTTTRVQVIKGGAATPPTLPALDSAIFNGWDRAFDNVTADMTVTAGYTLIDRSPITLNILQWTLTSAPNDAYYGHFTGSDIILYHGPHDLSGYTLPTGWAVQVSDKAMDAGGKPARAAVIYNTAKYAFDEAAGIFCKSPLTGVTNGICLAVPLLDKATNQQFVVVALSLGHWADAGGFGSNGKTRKVMNDILPTIVSKYPSASGIVISMHAETKNTNTGLVDTISASDAATAYVEGYDLTALYEVATGTAASYILTFMREGMIDTLDATANVSATDGISTNNGVRYALTLAKDEENE